MNKKQVHLYDWDSEPVDERPSEFSSTTGYSALSAYHSIYDAPLRSRPRRLVGFKTMVAVCIALLAFGSWSLVTVASMLRA